MKKLVIHDKMFDEERSLYNLRKAEIRDCNFAGVNDGESVLKECRDIVVKNCLFSLRYPLWHAKKFALVASSLDDLTRAPIWYSSNGLVESCKITGVKCLRECNNIKINNCKIVSSEFGWRCKNVDISNTCIDSVYFLFESRNVEISNLKMTGKYSFQYMKNVSVKDSNLDTKDAFWHSKNVTVENSVIKGEYLGWFSENTTFINCKIIGTQPFCYCKNLKLINCEMISTDLAFEYSDVQADINGHIDSIKNPKSGSIVADSIGAFITDNSIIDSDAIVVVRDDKYKTAC